MNEESIDTTNQGRDDLIGMIFSKTPSQKRAELDKSLNLPNWTPKLGGITDRSLKATKSY